MINKLFGIIFVSIYVGLWIIALIAFIDMVFGLGLITMLQ